MVGAIGIVYLIALRQKQHPRSEGRRSRFFGSTFWQAYFVEAIILGVLICVLLLRSLEYAWWTRRTRRLCTSPSARSWAGPSRGCRRARSRT